MKTFTVQQIKDNLKDIDKAWTIDGKWLKRGFEFADFKEAFSFMTGVALVAEKADHHPDWDNSYKKVNIALTTHEADGLTEKDFKLAAQIDKIAKYTGK